MKLLLLAVTFVAVAAAKKPRVPVVLESDSESQSYESGSNESDESLPLEDGDVLNGYVEAYFDQCIDHFDKNDPTCKNTFKQRYWYSDTYYKKGGPLYMYTGGEVDVSNIRNNAGWFAYGVQNNPMRLILENRFFGKSYPKPSTDRSSATMKLLTSKQALNDYAKLVKWFKKDKKIEGKTVAFGSSYQGTLAAWFRQMFPEIVNIAVASSAPLEYQFLFPEMVRTASKAIKETNPTCYNKIKSTFTCMESLVNGSSCDPAISKVKSKKELSKATGQCYDYFFYDDDRLGAKSTFFAGFGAQVWSNNYPATGAIDNCKLLLAQNSGDYITDYKNFLAEKNIGEKCRRKRASPVKKTKLFPILPTAEEDSDSEENYQKSFKWQLCYEQGAVQVSDKKYGMLGYNTIDESTLVNICLDEFPDTKWTADMIRKNVDKLNAQSGGKNYKGTCTIFTSGTYDPWRAMGLSDQSETSSANTVFLIKYGQHGEDMGNDARYSSNIYGKAALVEAQEKVRVQLQAYLDDKNC